MLAAAYIAMLCGVYLVSRRVRDEKVRKGIVWAYNYLTAFIIYFVLAYLSQPAVNFTKLILILLNTVYVALKGVAFDLSFQAYSNVYHLIGNEQIVELQIRIILLTASLQTVGTLTTVLFEEKIHEIKRWYRHKKAKEKIMIVGDNKNAISLIKDICKRAESSNITYYTNEKLDKDDKYIGKIRVKKRDDFLDEISFKKVRGPRSDHYNIVLMLNDENENMSLLGKLSEKADDHLPDDNTSGHIKVTVLCNNNQLRFHNWSEIKLDTYLVSEEQLVADTLMEDHSPIASLKGCGDLHDKGGFGVVEKGYCICLIGFGDLGKELLLSAYENSRVFKEDSSEAPFHALVIDKNMNSLKHSFLTDIPYFKGSNYIEFCDTAIGTEMFYQAIDEYLPDIHQFFISTNDDKLNIQTALKLSRYIRCKPESERKDKQEIIVLIKDKDYKQELHTMQEENLYTINISNDIYTYKNLIEREFDKAAESIHRNYMKTNGSKKEVKLWYQLDVFTKDSNRASARDYKNKRMLFKEDIPDKDIYWKLAEYEHYRWCAFHYARGWTRWMPNLWEKEKEGNSTKRVRDKKHLCLVDWKSLHDLPGQDNNVSYQKYDYENVVTQFKAEQQKG